MKTTSSIKNNDIEIIILSMCYRCLGNINRIMTCSHREHFNSLFIAVYS